MAHNGHRFLFALAAATFLALPLAAQPDPRVQQLEQRLDALVEEAAKIRLELDKLRGGTAASETTVEQPQAQDLTQIEVADAPPVAATPAQQQTPEPSRGGLSNSKALNPDISVIGNFLGKAGQNDFSWLSSPAQMQNSSIA